MRLSLSLRLFLAYCLFVAISSYAVFTIASNQIKPGIRQSTEETLVDTANLLAELLRDDVKNGALDQSRLPVLLKAYGQRDPQATIWGIDKHSVSHRIYVTNDHGIVLFDSSGQAVGMDYSQWNDVYKTLRGEYGARTSQSIPGDESSTIMYVAAPIKDAGRIIGVVTVAKPNNTVQPYIDRAQRRLVWLGSGLIAAGLLAGALVAGWLSRAIGKVTRYAQRVSEGQRLPVPASTSHELQQLATAVDSMRVQLEGKAYVERYVQTLTHELKSPLTAIQGAAELLQRDLPAEQRERLLRNIDSETTRLQRLVERLLQLAMVEQRQALEEHTAIALRPLLDELIQSQAARIDSANLQVSNEVGDAITLHGERFLLRQALSNLFDNALDFTPPGGRIIWRAEQEGEQLFITLTNQGEPIPEFALPRLTERFYSLPRPGTGRKSSGLGLNFVQEVAELHGGWVRVVNGGDGVTAEMSLKAD
jgi:two-component system, OmpR family, sensor histidine kinase CreC